MGLTDSTMYELTHLLLVGAVDSLPGYHTRHLVGPGMEALRGELGAVYTFVPPEGQSQSWTEYPHCWQIIVWE